jgi:hypothetical protein
MTHLEHYSPKNFLSRPEGKVGLAVSVAAGTVALYGLYAALPFMITFATNLLHLAALCGVLGLLAYGVLDPKWRALGSYVYRALFRAITGAFIEIDPIGILRSHIADLTEKLSSMRSQMGGMNGQIRSIERTIDENARMRDESLRLAHTGRSDPEFANASRLQARHAIKLDESNHNLSAMLAQMQTLARILKKLHDASELVLRDMQGTVAIKERERSSMKAAYSAYKSAAAILQGRSEGNELYDRAMEYLNDDYAKKLGEIEMFMDFSDGVIKSADLQNLAYDAAANEKLDQWELRLNESLLGEPKAQATGVAIVPAPRARVAVLNDDLDRLLAGPNDKKRGAATGAH